MLLLLGAGSILFLGIAVRIIPGEYQDPTAMRIGFVLLCFATYILTFSSPWVRNNLARIILIELLLYVIWLTYLIVINDLDVIIGAITFFSLVGISLVFQSPRNLLIFLISYFILITPVVLTIENPSMNPYIFMALLFTSGLLGYLILSYFTLIQDRLNRSNDDFRLLVDSIQDAIFLISKNYRVVKVNTGGVNILKKFFGRSIKEGDYILDFIYSQEQNKFRKNFERALSGELVNVQTKLYSKADKSKWFNFKFIPVRNRNHEVSAVLFSAFDITSQKASADIIEESEKRFRKVFEAAPIGMAILTLEGEITNVNSSFRNTLGFDSSDILEKSFVNLVSETNKAKVQKLVSKLRDSNQEDFQIEMGLHNDNGSIIHSITRVARINNIGKNDFLLAQIVDISKLKASEVQLRDKNIELEKANEELDRFVYSAAHDLRAPLTSVLGLINIVKNENGEDLTKYINLIEQSVIKLDFFIKDIIDYSRNSRAGISNAAIDLKNLIDKTFENHSFIENKTKIKHEVSVEGIEQLYSDPGRLEIILNNLISNSIKYYDPIKKDPFIRIKARVDEKMLDLEVIDNGIGIPPENLDKIFNIFYRGHEQSKGSGLGLYILKETVEKLNGVVKVDSELKKGTRFRIMIPNLVLQET